MSRPILPQEKRVHRKNFTLTWEAKQRIETIPANQRSKLISALILENIRESDNNEIQDSPIQVV